MYTLNEKLIRLNEAFVIKGIQYPPNWLYNSTEEERKKLGIVWVDELPRPDDRFYWVTDNNDGTYAAVPKELVGLKLTWTAQVNQWAYNILLPSDWMVVRKQEDGTDVPAEWTAYRVAVRTKASDIVTALTAAADIDAFIAVVTNITWPLDPNALQPVEAPKAAARKK
jgi:hypothetical protein